MFSLVEFIVRTSGDSYWVFGVFTGRMRVDIPNISFALLCLVIMTKSGCMELYSLDSSLSCSVCDYYLPIFIPIVIPSYFFIYNSVCSNKKGRTLDMVFLY